MKIFFVIRILNGQDKKDAGGYGKRESLGCYLAFSFEILEGGSLISH